MKKNRTKQYLLVIIIIIIIMFRLMLKCWPKNVQTTRWSGLLTDHCTTYAPLI